MQVKVTRSDGYSWHSEHVGEVFDVTRVTHHMRGDKRYASYEVDLTGRHHDAIAGTISARDCEVVDSGFSMGMWTDERIEQEVKAVAVYCDDADADWLWHRVYLVGSAEAITLLRKMRDEQAAERDGLLAWARRAYAWIQHKRPDAGPLDAAPFEVLDNQSQSKV